MADFALSGLQDARERLRSGVFQARGRKEWEVKDRNAGTEEYEVFCAFDFDQQLFRFDHIGTGRSSAVRQNRSFGGKYVRTNKYAILWINGSRQANIYPPEKRAIATMRPFDVRLVGLVNSGTLESQDWDWNRVLSHYRSLTREVTKEAGSLYVLSWVLNDPPITWRTTLDAKQGFSPIRLETFLTDAVGQPAVWEETGLPTLRETDIATWTQRNGVWVPSSLSMDVERENAERYELSFEWQSVNEPVDQSLFHWDGMGLATGTRIRDVRLGGLGIWVASIGDPVAEEGRAPQGSGRRHVLIIAANVLVLAIVMFLWYRRRFVKHVA